MRAPAFPQRPKRRHLAIGVAAIVAALVLYRVLGDVLLSGGACEDRINYQVANPLRTRYAIVGTWDCGATATATTFVGIATHSASKFSVRRAYLRVEDTVQLYREMDPANPLFASALSIDSVHVRWRGNDTLVVSIDRRSALHPGKREANGVAVVVEPR